MGGNIIYLDVMVVLGPLDSNLILGRDYVYVMGDLVSSLFRVICFPHEGIIMANDQLSCVGPNLTPNKPSSLNCPSMQVL